MRQVAKALGEHPGMQAVNFLVISYAGLKSENNKAEWVKAPHIK